MHCPQGSTRFAHRTAIGDQVNVNLLGQLYQLLPAREQTVFIILPLVLVNIGEHFDIENSPSSIPR